MRIAVFTECYRPIVNGVVVSITTFTTELRKLGHDVRIFAPAYPAYRDSEPYVYRLPSLPSPSSSKYPLAIPYGGNRLRDVFTQWVPNLIHAQHPFLCCREGRRWAKRLSLPLIFTYHTLIHAYAHYIPLPRGLVQAAAVRVSRQFANSADTVIVPTAGVEQVLRDYGVASPIDIIPTGLDFELLLTTHRQGRRAELGVPPEAPLVIYSGRIAREKNIEVLIQAAALLARKGSDLHIVLVGGGPSEREIRLLAANEGLAGRVHITGYVSRDEVFDWLNEGRVFCFPSLTDTQGVAVLEAMAFGCPPIALRSPAVEDVIRTEVDGLLVEHRPEDLAEGLAQVLGDSDIRERLAGQARRRAELFSSEVMAQRLIHVYERVLDHWSAG